MKRISFLILFAAFVATTVFGQDATQAQIDKLSGQIQDLLAAQEQQTKKIDALSKEISDLRDKVNTPQVSDSASRDDLKNLAEKVQEIDKKRQADRELILKELGNLSSKTAGGSGETPKHGGKSVSNNSKPVDDPGANAPATPQKGYYYTVKSGDTLAGIAKAYRDEGVKVTTTQILKANPGLDANKLFSGKKIFIPDPNAK
jgi:outer membrane murein-binding lipoprotein Lpp